MRSKFVAVGAAAALLLGSIVAGAEEAAPKGVTWLSDLDAAKAQAAKDGKDVMILFTGSDWCHWCKMLGEEITSKPEFASEAPKKFVFFEADFPRDKSKVPADKMAANKKLMEKYGAQGFPTIVLADAKGDVFAKLGYEEGGPAPFLKKLSEAVAARQKRDESWKKAEGATGVEKGKLLAEGLQALDEDLAEAHYATVIEEIRKLDPQDSTGIAGNADFKQKLNELAKQLMKTKETDAADKLVDDFIAQNKATGERQQKAVMMKLMRCPTWTVEGTEKADKIVDSVIAIDPNTKTAKEAAEIKPRIVKIREAVQERAKSAAEQKAAADKKPAEAKTEPAAPKAP